MQYVFFFHVSSVLSDAETVEPTWDLWWKKKPHHLRHLGGPAVSAAFSTS